MSDLFGYAFARLDRAETKRAEFASAWSRYIETHPWEAVLNEVGNRTFELRVRVLTPAPSDMSLVFGEWLAALRAALDNGLYAWAAAVSGQDPPPAADKLQFPICSTKAEFRQQARRLASLPTEIVARLEKVQPYQSPYGPDSNLLFWLHELARTDRHRTPHVGLGRIAEHHVVVGVPAGMTVEFDRTVQPYDFINREVVIARFTTSDPVHTSQIVFNPDIGITPEIRGWAGFQLNGSKPSLHERMRMMELYMRNHLENMALSAGWAPTGGYRTFDPTSAA